MTSARYVVTLMSEEYGSEEFQYDTLAEGLAGLGRLAEHALMEQKRDGIIRWLNLTGPDA